MNPFGRSLTMHDDILRAYASHWLHRRMVLNQNLMIVDPADVLWLRGLPLRAEDCVFMQSEA